MAAYQFPTSSKPAKAGRHQVLLVANGDLRIAANQKCWPEQEKMEQALSAAVAEMGHELVRAHPFKPDQNHGFIQSQKEGMEVFAGIDHRRVRPRSLDRRRYLRFRPDDGGVFSATGLPLPR